MNVIEPLIFLGGLTLLVLVVYFSFRVRPREATPRPVLNLAYPPPRVHLEPIEEIPWPDAERIAAKGRALILLGFEEVGCFEYAEKAGHFVWSFVHERASVSAVLEMVADTDQLEMVTFYADGRVWDYCDHPHWGWAKPAEGWTKRQVVGLDVNTIFARILAERPPGPFLPVSAENFVANYETQYARLMDCRNHRGGFDEEEIRALCKLKELAPTDEMVAECRDRIGQQALRGLEVAVIEQYLEQAGLSDEEANEQVNRLLIVHDRLAVDAVLNAFKYRKLWNPEILQEPMPADILPRQHFAWLNERFPGNKYRLLVAVTSPLPADVYLWPDAD